MKVAMAARQKHAQLFHEFSATLPDAQINQWAEMVAKWEREPNSAQNPYEMAGNGWLHLTLL
jgi:hypothetical protein